MIQPASASSVPLDSKDVTQPVEELDPHQYEGFWFLVVGAVSELRTEAKTDLGIPQLDALQGIKHFHNP